MWTRGLVGKLRVLLTKQRTGMGLGKSWSSQIGGCRVLANTSTNIQSKIVCPVYMLRLLQVFEFAFRRGLLGVRLGEIPVSFLRPFLCETFGCPADFGRGLKRLQYVQLVAQSDLLNPCRKVFVARRSRRPQRLQWTTWKCGTGMGRRFVYPKLA